ncbi:MAG: response regulator, partial [Chthoniobacterales bacterium]
AESVVGTGSTFWVKLPLSSKKSRREDFQSLKPKWKSPVAGKEFSILYIEDNDYNARLLQRILQSRLGVKFLTSMRGLGGVEMAREHLPDVILLDLYLPDISGEEVLAKLRQGKETAEIPVLVITADSANADRLLAAGAKSYLTKPLDMPKLFQAIEQALRGAATSDQS